MDQFEQERWQASMKKRQGYLDDIKKFGVEVNRGSERKMRELYLLKKFLESNWTPNKK